MSTTHWRIALWVVLLAILIMLVPIGMRIATTPFTFAFSDVPMTEAALVLGASVVHGSPSPLLAKRADVAIALFRAGRVREILVSADSRDRSHDEVGPVRAYLLSDGIPPRALILDGSGVDTYTSLFRAQEIFGIRSLTVATQDFHVPRALWIARHLGIDAYGVVAEGGSGSLYDYAREIPASWKALWDVYTAHFLKPRAGRPEMI